MGAKNTKKSELNVQRARIMFSETKMSGRTRWVSEQVEWAEHVGHRFIPFPVKNYICTLNLPNDV